MSNHRWETESGQSIEIFLGDLTQEKTDGIVNAANGRLSHGGGVAGVIVRKGGSIIQQESDKYVLKHGSVPTGQVAVTGAGRLACKTIIHAVGPVWQGGGNNEDALLHDALLNSLLKADELGLRSIAIPAISSGIFGFPRQRCAEILIKAAREFYFMHPGSTLRLIRFVLIDRETLDIFLNALM
jgi:O-acetyl-ADP-ribose deacetylase (regulator of RNase III)